MTLRKFVDILLENLSILKKLTRNLIKILQVFSNYTVLTIFLNQQQGKSLKFRIFSEYFSQDFPINIVKKDWRNICNQWLA